MPAAPPTDDFLKAAAARLRRREQAEQARRERTRARIRAVVFAFAVLLLVALLADLRNFSRRFAPGVRPARVRQRGDAADVLQGLAGPRYEDPAGRFSLVPPRHWVQTKPVDGFFDVIFQGPRGMDLSIQVAVTNGLTFDRLIASLREVEKRLAADTHMDIAYVGPHRVVKRTARLFRSQVLLVDFVTGDLAHHIQFSVPPELYGEYEPVFMKLLQTYEPGRILPAGAPPAGS